MNKDSIVGLGSFALIVALAGAGCSSGASEDDARLAARVAEYFRGNGESAKYNYNSGSTTCSAGTYTDSAGLAWAVTCPGPQSSVFKLSLSQSDIHSFQCEGQSLSAKGVTAYVELDGSGSPPAKIDIVADVGEGTNTDKKLDCSFRVEHGASSATITEKECSIDGDDVESTKLGISCS